MPLSHTIHGKLIRAASTEKKKGFQSDAVEEDRMENKRYTQCKKVNVLGMEQQRQRNDKKHAGALFFPSASNA